MKLSHKGALQLSVGFLVTIILTIVIFSLSIVFLRRTFTQATELSTELDSKTQQQIESLLVQGQKVAVPFHRKQIDVGGTGLYGLGIYNKAGENAKFKIEVTDGKDPTTTPPNIISKESVLYTQEIEIENNEQESLGILVKIPPGTPRGTYVFDVIVKCSFYPSEAGCDPPANNIYGIVKLYAEVR
ncbi:MAG: hypothetical protein QW331_03175 [Candidatus Woesearchaeota archaeon]